MLANTEFRSTFRRWGIVFLLLVMIAVLVFSIILGSDWLFTLPSDEVVPVSVLSEINANYQLDSFQGRVAAMGMAIIEDVIFDQQPNNENAAQQAQAIVSDLQTQVPTVTPIPTGSPTGIAAQTGTIQATGASSGSPTGTSIISSTPGPSSTYTLTAINTNTPPPNTTSTNTLIPSNTPSLTPTPTFTPTKTSTPTLTPTKTPTYTPTKTSTNVPTKTPTITPTNTPTLTPTATLDYCAQFTILNFDVRKKEISWEITNNSSQTILLTEIFLDWPIDNIQLKKIKLRGKTIWDIKDAIPPSLIFSDWKGNQNSREIKAGRSEVIKFEFDDDTVITGYYVELTFDYRCVISAEEY